MWIDQSVLGMMVLLVLSNSAASAHLQNDVIVDTGVQQ